MRHLLPFGRKTAPPWQISIICAILALGYSIDEQPSIVIVIPQGILVSVLLVLVGIMQFMWEKRDKRYIWKIPSLVLQHALLFICGICMLWAYFVSADYGLLFIGFLTTVISFFFLVLSVAVYLVEK